MSSFKDIRDFVFVGYAHDMFDDEEFCLLYDFYQSKNPDFPYNSYASFDLGEMDPAECFEFRVSSREMAHSLAGRQATDSPNIPVPTAFRLRWHRRAMYATEATGLPLSIQ